MFFNSYLIWGFPLVISQSTYDKEHKLNGKYEINEFKKYSKLNCTTEFTFEIIQLIIDYALWRNFVMLYIVDESINSGCNMKAIQQNLHCFNLNGISVALQRTFHRNPNQGTQAKKVLVVSFIKPDMDFETYLEQIKLISCWDEYFKWLNIYANKGNTSQIENRVLNTLRSSALTLSADAVIAIANGNSTNQDRVWSTDCCRRKHIVQRSTDDTMVDTLLPFNRTIPKNETLNVTFKELCGSQNIFYEKSFCMLQVYKIRKTSNVSLVVRPLGYWNYKTGADNLRPFQYSENRINFYGFPLIFGKKQYSQEANIVADENLIDNYNDDENLDEIGQFMSMFLNATQQFKTYTTLGVKAANGNWSGLLGAVVAQEVDVGLDTVVYKVPERYSDMAFTQDIIVSIRNIYLKPEQSHSARDIFYAPLQPQLLVCVLGTGLIFALAMTVYILFHSVMNLHERPAHTSFFSALSDALVWISGVFTMQGTLIRPRSYSGNIIVVISLVFALIIYNSYSAFITSMLSVKLTAIRSVDELLKSDYDIGYTRNSQDEVYLRSMNESQLNQIYLRGYLHNNINNITDGLLKATKGNYGFFATGHAARKQFLKISGYKCKYEIMEIPVFSTMNTVAFPMSPTSPYRKAVNLCLIKMAETGIHQYIKSLMAPSLPKCVQQTTYQSARINDLITSFGLLGVGILTGLTAILFECFWKKKRLIFSKLRRTFRSIDRNFEFVQ